MAWQGTTLYALEQMLRRDWHMKSGIGDIVQANLLRREHQLSIKQESDILTQTSSNET